MATPKPISREDLIGLWTQRLSAVPGVVTSLELRRDGSAEQRISLKSGESTSVSGRWEFDGRRSWQVILPRDSIEYDVVRIGDRQMDCTNWDDDAIIWRFRRERAKK